MDNFTVLLNSYYWKPKFLTVVHISSCCFCSLNHLWFDIGVACRYCTRYFVSSVLHILYLLLYFDLSSTFLPCVYTFGFLLNSCILSPDLLPSFVAILLKPGCEAILTGFSGCEAINQMWRSNIFGNDSASKNTRRVKHEQFFSLFLQWAKPYSPSENGIVSVIPTTNLIL